jgi:hypothetical protein
MTEQLMENLTNEEHERLLLMSEHAIAPPLSPAAQAVLTAFSAYPLHGDHIANTLMHGALPAALEALADHQTPAWDGGPLCHWTPAPHIRRELRAIAAELRPHLPSFPS